MGRFYSGVGDLALVYFKTLNAQHAAMKNPKAD
jgi:hypothetical protein